MTLISFLTRLCDRQVFSPSLLQPSPQQLRFKKSKRKKGAKFVRSPEQETARGKSFVTIFQRQGNPETAYQISTNIRTDLAQLTADNKTQNRRKLDHRRYNLQRYMELGGFGVHGKHRRDKPEKDKPEKDKPDEITRESAGSRSPQFKTSLTALQDAARLPRSFGGARFDFPHLFSCRAFYGPPTVESEPNRNAGNMNRCLVTFKIGDLGLSKAQQDFCREVVGDRRIVGDESGKSVDSTITLDTDNFDKINQNAALLGDTLDGLVAGCRRWRGGKNWRSRVGHLTSPSVACEIS